MFRAVSLGGGTQSIPMVLMALHDEFDARPDVSLFSDTKAEPRWVYDQVAWLKKQAAPFWHPVITVNERSILRAIRRAGAAGERMATPPAYVDTGGKREGRLWRQCTKEFKLEPIWARLNQWRETCGIDQVEMWIGITVEEYARVKPSAVKWITNRYPLIEKGLKKKDCRAWMLDHGYPEMKWSGCVCCPHLTIERLRDLRDNDPTGYRRAIRADQQIRKLPGVDGLVYLHRSLKPLAEVDISTAEERGQINLFINECEGVCST